MQTAEVQTSRPALGGIVWGIILNAIVPLLHVSASTVLFLSPILIGTLTIVTMIWAFSYGHRVRVRASGKLSQVASQKV